MTPAPILYPTPVGAAGGLQSPPQSFQPQQPTGYPGQQQQQQQQLGYPGVPSQSMYGGAKPAVGGGAYPGYTNPAAPSYTDPHSQPAYQPASLYNPQEHQPVQPVATVKPVEPPKPVVKADIPKEHIVLQEVLDKLVDECKKHANNVVSFPLSDVEL